MSAIRSPRRVDRSSFTRPRVLFDSWGAGASPGDFNNYALNTVTPLNHMPEIDHTFVGQRGLERLPNNFTVPGCCVP